jgi:hypothetical protein
METIDGQLYKISEDSYGESYRSDFLTMYQDYVASADTISARRHGANSFFVSINTALLGVAGYFGGEAGNLIWLAALAGILFSYTWRKLIQSYRSLNAAKFKVINELEQRLPFAAYDREWVHLKGGTDSEVHTPLSAVESRVPLVFMAIHFAVFIGNFGLWVSELAGR